MSRGIRIGLIVAVAVALTYPVAAWVIGIVVEKQNEADEQKTLADAPYVVTAKRDYRRGIFSSVVGLTYQISLPMAKGASDKGAFGPWHLTTRCVIHHGPLPRLQTFALATADCDLQLPPEMSQDVTAALAGKSPLGAYVRKGWDGGSTTTFTSPPFTLKLDNGVTVTWRGSPGHWKQAVIWQRGPVPSLRPAARLITLPHTPKSDLKLSPLTCAGCLTPSMSARRPSKLRAPRSIRPTATKTSRSEAWQSARSLRRTATT